MKPQDPRPRGHRKIALKAGLAVTASQLMNLQPMEAHAVRPIEAKPAPEPKPFLTPEQREIQRARRAKSSQSKRDSKGRLKKSRTRKAATDAAKEVKA